LTQETVDRSPLIARLAAHPPGVVALRSARIGGDSTGDTTYGELRARAAAVARALEPLDGATVALLAEPGAPFVAALLGIMEAGGIAVPLAPVHTTPELDHIVGDAQPRALLATAPLAPRLAEVSGGRPVTTIESVAAPAGPAAGPAGRAPTAGAAAIMLYTSGTTGRPKGVRLSHAAVAATLASLEDAWRWRSDDVLLHVLPLHHTHGLIVALLGALWVGASVRFASFTPGPVWDALGDVTVFMAVPTIYAKLMEAFREAEAPGRARWAAGARRLRLATSGSAALPAALFEEFQRATGQTILERYGMTEIGMALSNPFDGPRVAGAVGLPLPGVEVDVITDEGQRAAPGEPGELRVRSPQLFMGYAGDPAATAAAFDQEGRFRTGDTGARDPRGYLRILGRTSVDIIKSGGYKISALEIEAVLREHPAVADVAVIGAPDPTWGERVTACVVLRPGAAELSLEELGAFARAQLAPYKLPRALRLLDALPRNAMGKVQKKALR
jgi:malonyl-CoA/methylmalonyl-CoA synthetase